MTAETLPPINAALNGVATILLLTGYASVRRLNYRAHGWLMGSAFAVSTVFLVCYLIHKVYFPNITMDRFPGLGAGWKYFYYFVVLIPHLVLAMVMLPMILATFWFAYRRRWVSHRRMARPTFWIWLYVSITGVVIYALLYHLFPALSHGATIPV